MGPKLKRSSHVLSVEYADAKWQAETYAREPRVTNARLELFHVSKQPHDRRSLLVFGHLEVVQTVEVGHRLRIIKQCEWAFKISRSWGSQENRAQVSAAANLGTPGAISVEVWAARRVPGQSSGGSRSRGNFPYVVEQPGGIMEENRTFPRLRHGVRGTLAVGVPPLRA